VAVRRQNGLVEVFVLVSGTLYGWRVQTGRGVLTALANMVDPGLTVSLVHQSPIRQVAAVLRIIAASGVAVLRSPRDVGVLLRAERKLTKKLRYG